jgi:DNA-binding beta-propeller fold protein YncE
MEPSVNSLAVLPDGETLVIADREDNNQLLVLSMRRPQVFTAYRKMDEGPLRMAVLPDGLVAVTTRKPVIYLFNITAHAVIQSLSLRRLLGYHGIGGQEDGMVVVSCSVKDGDGEVSARVDVINRSGEVVRTVSKGEHLTRLMLPSHLCVSDGHVLLS